MPLKATTFLVPPEHQHPKVLRTVAAQLKIDDHPALATGYLRRADAAERRLTALEEHGGEIMDATVDQDVATLSAVLAALGWTPPPTLLEALDQIDRESAALEDDDESLREVRG